MFSDKLLVKEVQEMNENLPTTVKCEFPDHNNLAEFYLTINPNEGKLIFVIYQIIKLWKRINFAGLWKSGKFKFFVTVSEEYNMCPPKVKCLTKILHPNISSKFLN